MPDRVESLPRVHAKKKSATRFDSDLAGTYGVGALSLPYDQQIGLWLNLERIRLQWSCTTAWGIGMAFGKGSLGRDVYDAIAKVEEEVDTLMAETNAERRAQARWGNFND